MMPNTTLCGIVKALLDAIALGLGPMKRHGSLDRIEYDAVLIISTYKRIELLRQTLHQLRNEQTRYRVKILVLNDGNPLEEIAPIVRENPEVMFLHNRINNGKRRYWKTVTTLLGYARRFDYRFLIQMDDDFEPVLDFFDTIISYLNGLESGTILKYVTTENAADWGFADWVDGGTAYPRDFLDQIDHRIKRIPFWRWLINPHASSGVWLQVSKKVNALGYRVEFLSNSMADHLGYRDSVMNTALRREKELKTLKFKKKWEG